MTKNLEFPDMTGEKRKVSRVRLASGLIAAATLILFFAALRVKTTMAAKRADASSIPFPLASVKEIFPSAAAAIMIEPGIYRTNDNRGQTSGAVLYSPTFVRDVQGYAGETPTLIGLNEKGQVVGTALLPNQETDWVIDQMKLEGFLKRWNGLDAKTAREKKIDAITGATFSSNAIVETVRRTLAAGAGALPTIGPAKRSNIVGWPLAALAFLGALIVFPKAFRRPRVRLAGQLFSVLFVGCFLAFCLSAEWARRWVENGALKNGFDALSCLLLLTLVAEAVSGRACYCSGFCPYGAAQDLLSRLSKKRSFPAWLGRLAPKISAFCLAAVAASALFLPFSFTDWEPFAAFAGVIGASLGLAVLFLIAAFFSPRFWCRFFCPTGGFLRYFRRAFRRRKIFWFEVAFLALSVGTLWARSLG